MTWMQHYNQCKRKINGTQTKKEEDKDLLNDISVSSGNKESYKLIQRKRKRSIGSTSISDRLSCNKNNDITMKKECITNRRSNRKHKCNGSSHSINDQLINNNNNTFHIGTHDIMDTVDNFIYRRGDKALYGRG